MKKLLATTVALLICGIACAQNIAQTLSETESLLGKRDPRLRIDLDTRIDLKYMEGNEPEYSNFTLQNMRLIVSGEIIPGIRYRWRQRLNKSTTANPDGSGAATDYIWVAFDLGHRKSWTVTVGKQLVQLGTYEFNYVGTNRYLSTQVNSDFENTRIGIKAAYQFLGQTFNFQVMNAGSQMTDDGHSTRGLAAAAMWNGSLFNDVIGTRIGYAAFQHNSSKIYQWVTAGVQINAGIVTTELDFFRGDRMIDYSSAVEIREGRHHIQDMSGAANILFNLGKFRPSVKGVWDRRKDMELNADAYGNLGIQALLEYYPFPEGLLKDLRFHAAYFYKHTSFEGSFSSLRNEGLHTALVGMRWVIPVK